MILGVRNIMFANHISASVKSRIQVLAVISCTAPSLIGGLQNYPMEGNNQFWQVTKIL
jgi:hypothetical protein